MPDTEAAPARSRSPELDARRLIGDVGAYAIGMVVAQSVSTVSAPLFARILGPIGYGVVEAVTAAMGVLILLLGMGLDNAVLRHTALVDDERERARSISAGAALIGGACALAGLVLIPLATRLSQPLTGADGNASVVIAAAVATPTLIAANYARTVLRANRRPRRFGVSAFVGTSATLMVGVLLTHTFRQGAAGYFWAMAAASVAATLVAIPRTCHVIARPTKRAARELAVLGIPLIPAALANWSLVSADRLVLLHMADARSVGYYAVANKLANVLLFVVYIVGMAWTPFALQLQARHPDQAARLRGDTLGTITALIASGAIIIVALQSDVIRIFAGPLFLPAGPAVPWLCFSLILFAGVPVTQSALLGAGRTKAMGVHSTIAAGVNLTACAVLIPRFGISGAGAAFAIGSLYQGLVYGLHAEHIDNRRAPRLMLASVVCSAGLCMAVLAGPGAGWPWPARLLLGSAFSIVALTTTALPAWRRIDDDFPPPAPVAR